MRIRLNLPFDQGLYFHGFLPEGEANAIQMSFADGMYLVKVYLSDRNRQLSVPNSDIPYDAKELEKHQSLKCTALTMDIEVPSPPTPLLSGLEEGKAISEEGKFTQAIFDLVLETHSGIVSYFRNTVKQYWLEYLDVGPRNHVDFLDRRCEATWLDGQGKWRRLLEEESKKKKMSVRINLRLRSPGVNRQAWEQLPFFITDKHGQARMSGVLIANSLQHLSHKNGRLAVVEAVTALESNVKRLVPKAIARLPDSPKVTPKQIDKLMTQAGLRLVTDIGLKLIAPHAGFQDSDINDVAKAIDERNHIIHNDQREVDIDIARRYVHAIMRITESFQSWTDSRT